MLTTLEVPTVSVLLGMGCGGGALALLPADRVVAAANSWVSPLPLEGHPSFAIEVPIGLQRWPESAAVAAWQLKEDGIVDVVVPQLPDAAEEPDAFVSGSRLPLVHSSRISHPGTHRRGLALKRKRYGVASMSPDERFVGKSIPTSEFTDDDGQPDPVVIEAMTGCARPGSRDAVLTALAATGCLFQSRQSSIQRISPTTVTRLRRQPYGDCFDPDAGWTPRFSHLHQSRRWRSGT